LQGVRKEMSSRSEAFQLPGSVVEVLFAGDSKLYVVVDGASAPDLRQRLWQDEPEVECLYRGEIEPDIAHVAPYLIRLEKGSDFTTWLIQEGWGNHWGIFVWSPVDLPTLRRHFRKFLMVHDSEGEPLYFRYYDPRVLRTFLPLCNATDLAELFGPVTAYLMEAESKETLLFFEMNGEALQCRSENLS
jgi:hypothetical protein